VGVRPVYSAVMKRVIVLPLCLSVFALASCAGDGDAVAPDDSPAPVDAPRRPTGEARSFPRRVEAPRPRKATRVGRFRLQRRDDAPGKGLPKAKVFAVVEAGSDELHAATSRGLYRRSASKWEAVPGLESTQVSLLSRQDETQSTFAVTKSSIFQVKKGRAVKLAKLPGNPVSLAANPRVLIATRKALYRLKGRTFSAVRPPPLGAGATINQMAQGRSGQLAVAASDGLYTVRGGRWESLTPIDATHRWTLKDVRAVCFDDQDRLWFACPQGVGRLDLEWQLWATRDGIPYASFTSIVPTRKGAVWLGTDKGAVLFAGQSWQYRQGRRWLPGDRVYGIAADTHTGRAWFATDGGLGSVVETSQLTLARKAARYQSDIDLRHQRTELGYVAEVQLERPGDPSAWTQRDTDNDGLWTSLYGAAQSFLYSATKDPAAKARAKKAFEAIRFLSQVTQGGTHSAPPGFPARTVLPTSGRDPNTTYTPQRDTAKRKTDPLWKALHPRWPKSADGKWYWKTDTSSDELDGHMFFYAQYHDLVADEAERKRVADVVTAIVDHLLDNDYRLVDWDGKPTRWGNFNPKSLNHDPAWAEERGLNSLSMLAYLKVAQRVSGRARYRRAAQLLIEKHGYAQNVLDAKVHRGPGTGNQSDDQLLVLGFYTLLSYEEDPRLRATYSEGFRRAWELLRYERNPFFNFAYAGVCGVNAADSDWIGESIDSLKRYPLRPIRWAHRGSHRADIVRLPSPDPITGTKAIRGRLRDGRALPIDERWSGRWSDDPWLLDGRGNGRRLAPGTPFLLAYSMGLYHGVISD
jgi:hypothetical protein